MNHPHRVFRLSLASLLAACALGLALVGGSMAQSPAKPPLGAAPARVLELRIDDSIHPILAEHVSEAFDTAAREKYSLVLITMNTPGGLDSSMRDIIQRIISSPVPVCVYVSPSGRRAASAGFYILLSADIAAMAPGTDTGAATPIFLFGSPAGKSEETLHKKATNEAAAYLRTITEKRGRNTELAEKAVTDAKAFTEREALDGRLIDLIAASPEELLQKLNGREIKRFDGTTVKLDLPSPVRTSFEMSTQRRILSWIADPDVLLILILVAGLGLYIEFTHPGLFVPGIIGTAALLTVLIAARILPITALGVLLIGAAIVLFVLEAKFTSHGLLGLAGALCMIAGALFLIRSPMTGWGVSLGAALSVTAPFALISVFLMRKVIQTYSMKPSVGAEQFVGATGTVTEAVERPGAGGMLTGMAFVQGELWRVASRTPVPAGASIRVSRMDGLTLIVEPADAAKPAGTAVSST